VKAREKTKLPDTHLIVGDIQDLAFLEKLPPDFVRKCDKIFSNAALHWCKRDPVGVLMNAHTILKPGGLFVAEMGGHGNVSGADLSIRVTSKRPKYMFYCLGVRDALHTALHKRGIDPVARDPWFFPLPDEYTELLKLADFRPLSVSLHPRATTVADLGGWIRLFGRRFLEGIGPEEEQVIVNEVVETCRMSGAWREARDRKSWGLEYVRLRVVAMKGDIRS
jgi:SAM-dependent methyltransferase